MSEQLPPQGRITDPPPQNEPRLESWGEIATHLRRDIRTAQRWEKEFGLPVRRLTIGKHAQVYAYRSELDRWMLERQPKPEPDEVNGENKEIERGEDLDGEDSHERPEAGRREQWLKIGKYFAAAVIVVAAVAGIPRLVGYAHDYFYGPASKILLFVRPLVNQSLEPDQQKFVNGLTDELITQIGKLDPKRLGVFAPTTAMEMASKSIPEIKRGLGAGYVLEGSARREGDQLRIDLALVDTKDQTPVWTNSYTGDVRHILQLQDQISADVAKQMRVTLPAGAGIRETKRDVEPAVYEASVRGRLYWLDRDIGRSLIAYQQALHDDPKYAPALAGLATTYLLMGQAPNDALKQEESVPKARDAANQALAIDPKLGDPYCVLANIALTYDHDLGAAERLYKKAIEVDPSNVTAHEWYATYLMVTNQMKGAEAEMNRAREIDPASPLVNSALAEVKYYQRDYDGSITQAWKTLQEHPGYPYAELWMAWSYREKKMYAESIEILRGAARQSNNNPAFLAQYGHALAVSGDKAGAQQVLAQLRSLSASRYIPEIYVAEIYLGLGDKEQTLNWLEKAFKSRNDRLVYLAVDPIADPLRNEPRFKELLKRIGLP